jgi:hypothetical protein
LVVRLDLSRSVTKYIPRDSRLDSVNFNAV